MHFHEAFEEHFYIFYKLKSINFEHLPSAVDNREKGISKQYLNFG